MNYFVSIKKIPNRQMSDTLNLRDITSIKKKLHWIIDIFEEI